MLGRARQTLRVVAAGPSADARHAERTADILRELGADLDLVTAGLLHDMAKPATTQVWHRVAGVLLARFAPRVRRELARGDSTFARYLDHARLGAEMARRQGASDRVVFLIAGHHSPPRSEDARRLARADHEALP
ncbi:MAG TPA: HD domain-containing protein [Candidatus Limnocylindria bacterium]|nr:HD domain-containing protein [Candidatus Limnocylindria bacterium]